MKIKRHAILLMIALCTLQSFAQQSNKTEFIPIERGRLIVLADMGNEPDEEQQIMHLLMCSSEMDIEGLVAVTGKFLNPNSNNPAKQKLYPELFFHLIEGYEKVFANLLLHAPSYPHPDSIRKVIAIGQRGYGIEDIGAGKSSPGSELIIRQALKPDARPLYIVVNAGSNTLAQALYDYDQTHTDEEMARFIKKLRVYENGAQDNAGAWICHQYPDIEWIRSNYQTYCYGGPGVDGGFDNKGNSNELGPHCWQPYAYTGIGQHQWLLENIIGNHGPFGKYYPIRQFNGGGISFMEGGGTIPWLCLVDGGLSDIHHPEWGGWSGRFSREKSDTIWSKHQSVKKDEDQFIPFRMYTEVSDTWADEALGVSYSNQFAPVFRWREAFYNDFKCRMDWCKGNYANVNHHPIAVFENDSTHAYMHIIAKAGTRITLDAHRSFDPDNDPLTFHWFHYPEAGNNRERVPVENNNSPVAEFFVPEAPQGAQFHIILELSDTNPIGRLFAYRRVIIEVK